MSTDDKSVFDKMETSMTEVVQTVRKYHGEYFIGGLFIGLTKPSMGWALMSLFISLPTIVILKHPEWIKRFKDEKVEHTLLLMLLLASSDLYALHCLGKSFGYELPV